MIWYVRSHENVTKYGMFPYCHNCGITKVRYMQRWLKFFMWAHLETQDGLMDQPGIAIEPHS